MSLNWSWVRNNLEKKSWLSNALCYNESKKTNKGMKKMKKTSKTYQQTLEKIKNDIKLKGSYVVRHVRGSGREMDAALSIVESLDNLYKATWLDNRTIEITEIK